MCVIIIWHQHTRFLKMHGTGYWWHTNVNDKLFEKKSIKIPCSPCLSMRISLCNQALASLFVVHFLPTFLFLVSAMSQTWQISLSWKITLKILRWVTYLGSGKFWGGGWWREVPVEGRKFKCGHEEMTLLYHSVIWYVKFLYWKLQKGGAGQDQDWSVILAWSCQHGWFYK